MSKYKLHVKFTDEALKAIYASGEKLALVKEVAGDKGSGVAWVAANPFENNVIEWDKHFQIYASAQEIERGARIMKLSDTQAVTGVLYDFKSAVFQNPRESDQVGINEYGIQNGMDEYGMLTFGLAQAVTVNGVEQEGNPANAVAIPYNQICVMEPVEKIMVFLGCNTDSGSVIDMESGNGIEVEFRGDETEKTILYDNSKGMFIPE